MIGKDFHKFGEEKYIIARYGNGNCFPFRGPVKVKSISKNSLAVIDYYKNAHLQQVTGSIDISFCCEKSRIYIHTNTSEYDSSDEDESYQNSKNRGSIGGESKSPPNQPRQNSSLDIVAVDICSVPLSRNIAIADYSDNIKVINCHELFLDRIIGELAGSISFISGIDCFKLGFEVIYCISEKGQSSQRIQLLSEGGKIIESIGEEGSSLGQFREISSVSTFTPSYITASNVKNSWFPEWHLGRVSIDELYNHLCDNPFAGNFCVCQRINDENAFDVVYVPTDTTKKLHVSIRVNEDNKFVVDTSGPQVEYESLADILRSFPFLKRIPDDRPFVSIAVADRDNFRVQILRYYWTDDIIHPKPGIMPLCEIGGMKKRIMNLIDPISVSYSPTGELAILDFGTGAISILSDRFEVLKSICVSFSNPTFNQKFRKTPELLEVMERNKRVTDKACSVAFTHIGTLAVGYKKGGIILHKGFRIFPMGDLMVLREKSLFSIISYCDYDTVVNLRNTCRYFHNITRRLRLQWQINPLRTSKHPYMLHLFSSFGRLSKGETVQVSYVDAMKRPICRRLLLDDCNDLHCQHSHDPIVLDLDEPQLQQAGLEYKSFLIVCSELFGTKTLWQNERYIEELFLAFSSERIVTQRRDPMTRKNEVKRIEYEDSIKLLMFLPYLDLITLLEEDYVGVLRISDHPMFRNRNLSSYQATQVYDVEAIQRRLYDDPMIQYDRGIDVPYLKPKSKRFIPVKGMENAQRNEIDAVTTHIETFKMQSNKASALISNLFK